MNFEINYNQLQVASLALIKRYTILQKDKPIQAQLQIINLPGYLDGGNPYETLHSYIHNAVSPYFNAYVNSKSENNSKAITNFEDKDVKAGIPMTRKKIAELELSLLHLQQNVEIPEIILEINPVVMKAIEECKKNNEDPKTSAFNYIPKSYLSDSLFLDKLQKEVQSWVTEIRKVADLNRDPSTGTASQEINFWLGMENSITSIEKQLIDVPVLLTLEVLKNAKRYHATISFHSDTGLMERSETVRKYAQVMKDFPINELLSALDLDKVKEALEKIFNHLLKKLKVTLYPTQRSLPLVEAISRDLNNQLMKILSSKKLMYMPFEEFENVTNGCDVVFNTWKENSREFTNIARDTVRRRKEKFILVKIDAAHEKLQERINFIKDFRIRHEHLQKTIEKIIKSDSEYAGDEDSGIDSSTLDDVSEAYSYFKNIDILDVSLEGTEAWNNAENLYNEKIEKVENQIIIRLRSRLEKARNANEMFRAFSKFNALFFSQKIRNAILEYQTPLIDSTKNDIKKLHEKFIAKYPQSQVSIVCQARDIPPIAGNISWAKQIDNQLDMYMKRVEDVLGKGWEKYTEGEKLKKESDAFKIKLDTRPMFDAWIAKMTSDQNNILITTGKVFVIKSYNDISGGDKLLDTKTSKKYVLDVNYDPQTITFYKEIRQLIWLKFNVPYTLIRYSKEAKRIYPYAVSLKETVKIYYHAGRKVDENHEIISLIAIFKKKVQDVIVKGANLCWENFIDIDQTQRGFENTNNKQIKFVKEFYDVVSIFQDKVDEAILINDEVNHIIDEMKTCDYEKEVFYDYLDKIQKSIDKLNLESYSNLNQWVSQLDARIEAVLIQRLENAIKLWINAFQSESPEIGEIALARKKRNRLSSASNLGLTKSEMDIIDKDDPKKNTPEFPLLIHELKMKNQLMFLDPPIENARAEWYYQFQDWLSRICSLKHIQGSRYDMNIDDNDNVEVSTYINLLTKLSGKLLEQAYEVIENRIKIVNKYLSIWLRYQSLWDLEPDYIYNQLKDDLSLWKQIVLEIKKARSTFDNSETAKTFGNLVIDYAHVQSKVNAKYDSWQRDVQNKFGSKLLTRMKEFFDKISKARYDLEQHSAETSSTAEAVSFITFVQDLKKNMPVWTQDVELFRSGQKILEKQRYQVPKGWIYMDQIDGEWSAFKDILARKNNTIQEQLAGLQQKIVAEDSSLEQKIKETTTEWEKTKPVQGDIKPDTAVNKLNIFEGRLERLKESYDQITRAKEALSLEYIVDDRLTPLIEELRDLKSVWIALSKIWGQLDEIKDTLWNSVVPRKIRQSIDQLINSTKELPTRMRQYAAYEYLQDTLKGYLKVHQIFTDLKSEAIRERHWKQLLKELHFDGKIRLSELTVGNVWEFDLHRNENVIRGVIEMAQGEMALEEFLKQVKETWTNYALELINYQNKCRLIKGFQDLFTKCGENINSLIAMKHSPYFKVFEEEALSWEEKLNRIHVLFDVWIDVQRQWVYLEGIFTSSADIKQLLPVETTRFQNINTEFMTVMKKVYKSPFVLDILAIPNIQKSLERLAELLSKIQKALGEYLERERSSFPRFYFVGDEDLLEIIGNSKDVVRIQKHFKKMFAGIASIILNDDTTEILGMVSKEGEIVNFNTPVSIKNNPRINDWLTLLEKEMKYSLAYWLLESVKTIRGIYFSDNIELKKLLEWVEKYPAQLIVLSMQIIWTQSVENALENIESNSNTDSLQNSFKLVEQTLNILADTVLTDLTPITRKKCEHLITELVHQRDVIRQLINHNVKSPKDFEWLYQMRFYYNENEEPLLRLCIQMANARFYYGYEYLGVAERLVQTPLTDRCYLTLTQALDSRMGGSPFGPAGTGKTESVKALGLQLGRFVLVFCCDENFDFQAMGRIFIGLCQVGAWGCFDEFNRLAERILSAVSQQIQSIQIGLRTEESIDIVGKNIKVNSNTGIFITMNPGYAGRSNLPDNLKKLFRNIAMTRPDRELIAQVMLFSQGFRSAELLSSKVVPLFNLCLEQLSPQSHYDFGLRSLKSVLVSAGNLKRTKIQDIISKENSSQDEIEALSDARAEQEILIQSIRETIVPKLVVEDIPLLTSLLMDVFPGIEYSPINLEALCDAIKEICEENQYECSDMWVEKVIQLYQIQNIHHGLMMVGPSGSGKTSAWQVLLKALEKLEGVEGVSYVINPKAISKDSLYGFLDQTTREWTDGLFTHILRKIIDNVRGESEKRHWIIFDGDVDPEWVENLNSVLDDNKLLTLPNGERLSLPRNVRIMFEVDSLKYATLATVSRCGMIWFSEDVLTLQMIFNNYLNTLRTKELDKAEEDVSVRDRNNTNVSSLSTIDTQKQCADILKNFFKEDGLVEKCLKYSYKLEHIMDFTRIRVLNTLFSLINSIIGNVIQYNNLHPDFPLNAEQLEIYISKKLLIAIIWSFTGDAKLDARVELSQFIQNSCTVELPTISSSLSIADYDVDIKNGGWISLETRVPTIEIEPHTVSTADVVIPTIDTVKHEDVIYSWLSEHKPLILCGPPGSGKTMTLFSALRKLPDMEVVGLNFSSATTPELILKTFEQYCEYRKTPNGVVLCPTMIGRWLVIFCDEINLPAADKYGTQRVLSFIRQLIESGGFWRTTDQAWVKLERIQFVGACNPPTDPGRVLMSHRFLRHAPLVMVNYPGELSLKQIYGTFSRAALKVVPSLRGYAEPLTNAMVEFFLKSQQRFTPDIQAHYIYSPRELTRWIRGIYEAIKAFDDLSVEGLIRIWAHEALRLFQDRLVTDEEKLWTDTNINEVAMKHFPNCDHQKALERPILFSNWLSKNYVSVSREELREFVKARLKVFYEEELDVPLVLFNDVLDHVLRIDRVFRQMQGHMLLIGVSGSGKTTLSRFVAWMNGLSVFQIKVHNKYSGEDFDEDLRTVLRRAGCKDEKICFIMDESNVLDSGFLERMNTLLANAEVPGLFEGDEYASLMTQCKEGSQKEGLMLDSGEELYKWFTGKVMKNLHVIFTMNPPEEGLASRAATSPALFNRCVLDWFGDWSDQAFFQVGTEFTNILDLDLSSYSPPADFPIAYQNLPLPPTHRNAIINAFVFVHQSLYAMNTKVSKRQGKLNYVTPRHYLDFINHYVRLFQEKREDLEDQQRHLNIGLDRLKDTVSKVEELRKSLAIQKTELETKNTLANEKLQKMLADQQEAMEKQKTSLEIQEDLKKKEKEIEERKAIVMADLAKAEPAVIEAQKSVSNIKKQQLTEVRAMGNPPDAVKMAMESVCTLLNHKITDWKSVQSVIRRDDFISSIVNFDTKKLTPQMRDHIRHNYMSNPKYNFDTVNRASKACGPLVKWVIAQTSYSDILERVGPLRREVQQLEETAKTTKVKADEIIKVISELEISIAARKQEYAVLISEIEKIKAEMERNEVKVNRSIKLIENLSSEKERWQTSSETFEVQMSTIVGDVLLSSAFLAYAGYFDQQYREQLFIKWSSHLDKAGIKYKTDLSLPEYLSTADDRLAWQSNELPVDDLCTENAIMLKRFNRYPLIIDPSGQATQFLMNEYKDRKITVTSFLDDAFLKNLESALRFGNPLLVQDVEHLDPILNAVLNKELRRAGGRVLIRLGGQDIDFSPSFTLFLSTRDPSVNFSPDICSRVTFVNFTITRASLQSQCLHQVLKAEKPEVDKKRNDLLKLQGEFQLKLRHLEKSLLKALNESKGNILDDDNVITTLETLKQEAAEITRKVEETDTVMMEVESVTNMYAPLAQSCSAIYFSMEQLNQLHHFYQFSLDFFFEIFEYVLHNNPHLKDKTDSFERLNILYSDLFDVSYERTSHALLHEDHITLALLLVQIKLRGSSDQLNDDEFEFLISGGNSNPSLEHYSSDVANIVGKEVANRLCSYFELLFFEKINDHIINNKEAWEKFMSDGYAENYIPVFWDNNEHLSIQSEFRKLLVIKCFRPDRLIAATNQFINIAFGENFNLYTEVNLNSIVNNETTCNTPIAFCSVPGYDVSNRIEKFAQSSSNKLVSLAMGSAEGFSLAEQAITNASKRGTWVLLKNVHLAPQWLSQLEKRMHSIKPNPSFRLFLTMETNPKVPINLLRMSRVLMFEPPPGIKANLQETLRSIATNHSFEGPAERSRLHFLLAWLHAVVQERLRYAPLGWTKTYEFNDSDQESALDTIDFWINEVSQGRSNIAPNLIPWDAIRTLIKETVYGGKIDNEFDQYLLDSFVNYLFTPKSYELDFPLVKFEDGTSLTIPEGTKVEQFMEWVNKLPEQQPTWLGLPSHAEKLLLAIKGNNMLSKVRQMKSITDDEAVYSQDEVENENENNLQPSWMKTLYNVVNNWLTVLPEKLSSMIQNENSIQDPLFRFFNRENTIAQKLLIKLHQDLKNIKLICEGKMQQTNYLRKLMDTLNKGLIPIEWKQYKVCKDMTINQWINDFARRVEHLEGISQKSEFENIPVWIGGLFIPEAYITATRQASAHKNKWSLEELELELSVDNNDKDGFNLINLTLEGGSFENGMLQISSKTVTEVPSILLKWVKKGEEIHSNYITLPVYLNEDRTDLLFRAKFDTSDEQKQSIIQHSVAFITSNNRLAI